jgi:hypothetical protein
VLEAILGIGVVLPLLALGFWLTRGAGGVPGGTDDPAMHEVRKYTVLGDRVPDPAAQGEDREHEVE